MNEFVFKMVIGLIKLLSKLPLSVLYRISDFMYLIVHKVIKHRVHIVRNNLKRAFPSKTEAELMSIEVQFYKNFCDLVIEYVYLQSMDIHTLNKHFTYTGLEPMRKYLSENRGVIVTMGHQMNWELSVGFGENLKSDCDLYPVHKPLRNKQIDKYTSENRARFGATPIPMDKTSRTLKDNKERNKPFVVLLIADQAASKFKGYWTKFMGIDSPFYVGPDILARKTDSVVFFAHITKIKRGYYNLEMKLVTDTPEAEEPAAIIEKYIGFLESALRQQPDTYLWTHNRWKHTKPSDEELKAIKKPAEY